MYGPSVNFLNIYVYLLGRKLVLERGETLERSLKISNSKWLGRKERECKWGWERIAKEGGGSPRQRFSPGPEGGSRAGEAEGAVSAPWSRKVVLGQEIPILVLASGGQNQAISVELGTRTELECVWEGLGDKIRQESWRRSQKPHCHIGKIRWFMDKDVDVGEKFFLFGLNENADVSKRILLKRGYIYKRQNG